MTRVLRSGLSKGQGNSQLLGGGGSTDAVNWIFRRKKPLGEILARSMPSSVAASPPLHGVEVSDTGLV